MQYFEVISKGVEARNRQHILLGDLTHRKLKGAEFLPAVYARTRYVDGQLRPIPSQPLAA